MSHLILLWASLLLFVSLLVSLCLSSANCSDISARNLLGQSYKNEEGNLAAIDWREAEIRATAEIEIERAGSSLTDARRRADRRVEERAHLLLLEKLMELRLNDHHTIEENLQETPRLQERFVDISQYFQIRFRRPGAGSVSIEIALPFGGPQGIYSLLVDESYGSEQIPQVAANWPVDKISGLIFFLDHLPQFTPSLEPRIYSEEGLQIYGPGMAGRQCAARYGPVTYKSSASSALKDRRAGEEPYSAYAAGILGRNGANFYLNDEDSSRILSSSSAHLAMRRCAVFLIIH